jgi:hypothetical protein
MAIHQLEEEVPIAVSGGVSVLFVAKKLDESSEIPRALKDLNFLSLGAKEKLEISIYTRSLLHFTTAYNIVN